MQHGPYPDADKTRHQEWKKYPPHGPPGSRSGHIGCVLEVLMNLQNRRVHCARAIGDVADCEGDPDRPEAAEDVETCLAEREEEPEEGQAEDDARDGMRHKGKLIENPASPEFRADDDKRNEKGKKHSAGRGD